MKYLTNVTLPYGLSNTKNPYVHHIQRYKEAFCRGSKPEKIILNIMRNSALNVLITTALRRWESEHSVLCITNIEFPSYNIQAKKFLLNVCATEKPFKCLHLLK